MMVKERMTVEQMDHFLRHVKMHADELRNGTFSKDITYLEKLREAQRMAIDISHEMFHIMRRKGFENYAGQDFVFNVAIPEDLEHYEFHMFDYESFRLGCKSRESLKSLWMMKSKSLWNLNRRLTSSKDSVMLLQMQLL